MTLEEFTLGKIRAWEALLEPLDKRIKEHDAGEW